MFGKLQNREKPRVDLGILAAAPRTIIKRHLEQWSDISTADLYASLSHNLKDIFLLSSGVAGSLPQLITIACLETLCPV